MVGERFGRGGGTKGGRGRCKETSFIRSPLCRSAAALCVPECPGRKCWSAWWPSWSRGLGIFRCKVGAGGSSPDLAQAQATRRTPSRLRPAENARVEPDLTLLPAKAPAVPGTDLTSIVSNEA